MHFPEQIFFSLEQSFDGIWINDAEGRVVYMNHACEEFFGINRRDVIGMPVKDMYTNGTMEKSAMMDAMENKKRCTRAVLALKTGRRLLCTANPVFIDGKIDHFVCNLRDVTEESDLKVQLDALRRLSQLQKAEILELRQNKNLFAQAGFVFQSRQMSVLNDLIHRAALSSATILLEGESGVGKSVVARLIHAGSARNAQPFIVVNCAAIPYSIIESELFGHRKGAFTDACQDKIGMLELANGGTVFFDEIGELPLPVQVKLLRVLQERQIQRVGDTRVINLDIRVIAATNKSLEQMVAEKTFREDLFYRINVINIRIPSLRDRKDDVPVLAMHMLEQLNRKKGTAKYLSWSAQRALENYDWPGNVRELENCMERAHALTVGDEITEQYFPDSMHACSDGTAEAVPDGEREESLPLKEAVSRYEKRLILKALSRYGSMRRAAEALGTDHSSISRKAAKYGIAVRYAER